MVSTSHQGLFPPVHPPLTDCTHSGHALQVLPFCFTPWSLNQEAVLYMAYFWVTLLPNQLWIISSDQSSPLIGHLRSAGTFLKASYIMGETENKASGSLYTSSQGLGKLTYLPRRHTERTCHPNAVWCLVDSELAGPFGTFSEEQESSVREQSNFLLS